MSYYQILENILTMNGYCNEPNNIFQKKDIKAIPYLQKKWYFNYQKLRNVK